MQVVLKWIAQFLLLPLLKDLGLWIVEQVKKAREYKKVKEDATKKGESYENSSPDNAHDEFNKLP
jgi:hypothetical protein